MLESIYTIGRHIYDWISNKPDEFQLELFSKLTTLCGIIVAFQVYRTNNRIKAAEFLISLEKEYKSHITVLTEIESNDIYNNKYDPVLKKLMDGHENLNKCEIDICTNLETAIRYFYLCSKLGRLGVDKGHIRFMSAYYLKVLVFETKDGLKWYQKINPYKKDRFKRPLLRDYMYRYWHGVYFWAPHSRRPWPARIIIYIHQSPYRVQKWLQRFYD